MLLTLIFAPQSTDQTVPAKTFSAREQLLYKSKATAFVRRLGWPLPKPMTYVSIGGSQSIAVVSDPANLYAIGMTRTVPPAVTRFMLSKTILGRMRAPEQGKRRWSTAEPWFRHGEARMKKVWPGFPLLRGYVWFDPREENAREIADLGNTVVVEFNSPIKNGRARRCSFVFDDVTGVPLQGHMTPSSEWLIGPPPPGALLPAPPARRKSG